MCCCIPVVASVLFKAAVIACKIRGMSPLATCCALKGDSCIANVSDSTDQACCRAAARHVCWGVGSMSASQEHMGRFHNIVTYLQAAIHINIESCQLKCELRYPEVDGQVSS
jgi:hypothetical protein